MSQNGLFGNLTQNGNMTQNGNGSQNRGGDEDEDAIFSIYGDPHRMFVQAMMSRSIISGTFLTVSYRSRGLRNRKALLL